MSGAERVAHPAAAASSNIPVAEKIPFWLMCFTIHRWWLRNRCGPGLQACAPRQRQGSAIAGVTLKTETGEKVATPPDPLGGRSWVASLNGLEPGVRAGLGRGSSCSRLLRMGHWAVGGPRMPARLVVWPFLAGVLSWADAGVLSGRCPVDFSGAPAGLKLCSRQQDPAGRHPGFGSQPPLGGHTVLILKPETTSLHGTARRAASRHVCFTCWLATCSFRPLGSYTSD